MRCATVMCSSPTSTPHALSSHTASGRRPCRCAAHGEGARTAARARLLRTLDSQRTEQWAHGWREHLRAATQTATGPCTAVVAEQLVRDQAKKLRKRGDRLRESTTPVVSRGAHSREAFAVHARFICAALWQARAGIHARARQIAGCARNISRYVGSRRTLPVAHRGRPQLPPTTSFLIGRLVERDSRALDECRHKFAKAYRRTTRRRWRELQGAMRAHIAEIAAGEKRAP